MFLVASLDLRKAFWPQLLFATHAIHLTVFLLFPGNSMKVRYAHPDHLLNYTTLLFHNRKIRLASSLLIEWPHPVSMRCRGGLIFYLAKMPFNTYDWALI